MEPKPTKPLHAAKIIGVLDEPPPTPAPPVIEESEEQTNQLEDETSDGLETPTEERETEVKRYTPEQWKNAKLLAVAGMPPKEIAAKLGMTSSVIRWRSSYERWPTPERIETESAKIHRERLARTEGEDQTNTDDEDRDESDLDRDDSSGEELILDKTDRELGESEGGNLQARPLGNSQTPLKIAAESLLERGRKTRLDVLKLVEREIRTTKSLAIETWKDLETAQKLADKVTGLEVQTPQIALLFPGNGVVDSSSTGEDSIYIPCDD
jgi:hypothetical protein